jgi:two-component system, OmpR family, copper resistance phosphate regulon response regulator CusR
MPMRILLVQEELQTARYLQKGLTENGFTVDVVRAGPSGLHTSPQPEYDLLVCDVPPGMVRVPDLLSSARHAPVLFLTERNGASISVQAQDGINYLLKPFAFSDFLAKVQALLRSASNQGLMTLRVAGLEVDLVRHRVTRDGRRLNLTPKEFLLLSLLMRRTGEVLSRAYMADQVWDINFESNTNFVDVHIRRLRSKVDDPFPAPLIYTVRGMGYVLEAR